MGKRVKKKRAMLKEKQVAVHSPKSVPHESSVSVNAVNDGSAIPKKRKPCTHLKQGFDLNRLSEKIRCADRLRCEDCREGMADRRGAKGKGKHGKKGVASAIDSKSDTKALWICLQCGHCACGGIGLPTTSQSHAVRHARQTHHSLVVQWENPHLRWCFQCNTLIPFEKTEENGEKKDALMDVVKLIKAPSSEQSAADVEDVWFGGGSDASKIKTQDTISSSLDGRVGYMVRGLVNLGNTCFFNSVLQNLLAMDRLRDYFLDEDAYFGPLSTALKKLFLETKPEIGLKNVVNPRSFFGSVCSKAPQFRGYQQQDSHEFLRCLLDGLSTEELFSRKQMNASGENGLFRKHGPTFVDAAFGGRISSTVCCIECGHSSTVYESFLDLSLPVPTKKTPTKRSQLVSRGKKTKMPPKRGGRIQQKASKETAAGPENLSAIAEPPCQIQSTMPVAQNMVSSLHDRALSDSIGSSSAADESGSASQNFSSTVEFGNEQVVESSIEETTAPFEYSWMDYLGTETIAAEHGNDFSVSHNSSRGLVPNYDLIGSDQACAVDEEPSQNFNSSVNPLEEEVPPQVQSSEVLLLPYKEESFSNREAMGEEAEASSSVVGCGQDEADFDGFSDLFNEPEASVCPVAGPSLNNEVAETSFTAGNCGESDPDEVDDTNSPVSVESCLAHFVKPELLSKDNAWECENCSKVLQQQRLVLKKKQAKSASEMWINGGEAGIQSPPLGLDKDFYFTDVRNLSNGDAITGTFVNSIAESMVSSDGKIDHSNRNCLKTESSKTDGEPSISRDKECRGQINGTSFEQSHCSGDNESQKCPSAQTVGSCSIGNPSSAGHTSAIDQQNNSQVFGNCESEEKEDEEKICKTVNVKRDATKRVFIDKAPHILTIHLKRFSQDGRGRLSKLNGHVNFRDTLDLSPYMDPRCPDVDKQIYRLLGIVEHSGTMRGGHYVAYVRGVGKGKSQAVEANEGCVWYHASDAYVREVSLEEALRREAYILFYERI